MSFYSLPERQHAILNMIIFLWDVEMGNEISKRLGMWLHNVHMQSALFDYEILLAFLHECTVKGVAIHDFGFSVILKRWLEPHP